jgi:pimeloyl-ACP methyl ester carboxylesterase
VYAIAFDGEDYLLVGQSNKDNPNEIAITHVPEPVITSRSVGSTIRFFFYKKLGIHTDDIGLRYAVLDGDKPVYTAIDKSAFKPSQTVALMVHGFTSETHWMVTGLLPWLRQNVLNYDHCITFDYESFGTGVADNGSQLALALRQQCGFGPDDKITVHLYAHSMGCVVSRCAIELSGGAEMIDKAVLAGPPNNGTTLASTGKGLAFIISQTLGHAVPGPVGTVLRKGIDQLYKQGLGIADLVVQSPMTRQINALAKPDHVPYLALVGLNSPDPTQQARLQRLAHKMLDTGLDLLFGEQNDGVIGKSSLQGVRNGSYPALTKQDVLCDHFGYYVDGVALRTILEFIRS